MENAVWKIMKGGGKVLLGQILGSFGNQNREFGYEILGNYVFLSLKQCRDMIKAIFLENPSEFGMKV